LQREVQIDEDDTTGSLVPKMAAVGAELLMETLDRLAAGDCPRILQDHSKATVAPSTTPADTKIDWTEPAYRIRNRIRALSPRPGAFAVMKGRKIKLWNARVREDLTGAPGEVLAITKEGVQVAAGEGALSLLEVQPDNSRRMTAPEWARGARLCVGDLFQDKALGV
jgi:methionyl-tRNA formyltransferase